MWLFVSFLSHSNISKVIHIMASISTCYSWIIFHFMDILQFVYPLIPSWHLDYFYILAIVKSIAINIHVQVSVEYLFSNLLFLYLGAESLRYMIVLCLTFEGVPNCIPQWLNYFVFPPATYMDSNFSLFLPTQVVFCFLIFAFVLF